MVEQQIWVILEEKLCCGWVVGFSLNKIWLGLWCLIKTRARRTTVALARQVQSTLLYVTINGSTFTSTKLSVFKNDIKVSLKN